MVECLFVCCLFNLFVLKLLLLLFVVVIGEAACLFIIYSILIDFLLKVVRTFNWSFFNIFGPWIFKLCPLNYD